MTDQHAASSQETGDEPDAKRRFPPPSMVTVITCNSALNTYRQIPWNEGLEALCRNANKYVEDDAKIREDDTDIIGMLPVGTSSRTFASSCPVIVVHNNNLTICDGEAHAVVVVVDPTQPDPDDQFIALPYSAKLQALSQQEHIDASDLMAILGCTPAEDAYDIWAVLTRQSLMDCPGSDMKIMGCFRYVQILSRESPEERVRGGGDSSPPRKAIICTIMHTLKTWCEANAPRHLIALTSAHGNFGSGCWLADGTVRPAVNKAANCRPRFVLDVENQLDGIDELRERVSLYFSNDPSQDTRAVLALFVPDTLLSAQAVLYARNDETGEPAVSLALSFGPRQLVDEQHAQWGLETPAPPVRAFDLHSAHSKLWPAISVSPDWLVHNISLAVAAAGPTIDLESAFADAAMASV